MGGWGVQLLMLADKVGGWGCQMLTSAENKKNPTKKPIFSLHAQKKLDFFGKFFPNFLYVAPFLGALKWVGMKKC